MTIDSLVLNNGTETVQSVLCDYVPKVGFENGDHKYLAAVDL